MALNAATTVGGQPVQGTPSRDRDRHPFPLSAQPSPAPSSRQTTSSASNSYTHLPISSSPSPLVQVSSQTTTVEALLKQHVSTPDPMSAALEHAVNERNVLTAQNTQLWRLVEKQRTGYNQILKELERIRGERDVYKSRLITLNGGQHTPSDKRHRTTSDRNKSLDTYPSQSSSTSTILQVNHPQSTHNFEDTASRNLDQPTHLHASRSYDPLLGRANDNGLQLNANYSLANATIPPAPQPAPLSAPALNHMSISQGSKPSPSPLAVPRSIVVATSSPAASNSPDSPSSRHPMSSDANTMTKNSAEGGIYSSLATSRPLVNPRKSSLADSVSSAATSSSVSSSASSTFSSQTPNFSNNRPTSPYTPQQQQYQAGVSIQSNSHSNPVDNNYRRTSTSAITSPSSSQLPPPIITTAATVPPTSLHPPPQSQTLTAIPENRPQFLSRDSRISLPEEARHYIANMADSPVPSPHIDAFSSKSKLSASVFPPPPNMTNGPGRASEFLDMDEEEEEGDNESDDNVATGDPAFSKLQQIIRGEEDGKSMQDYVTSQPPELQIASSSRIPTVRESIDGGRRRDKTRVVAEEFPLPPPSNLFIQRQTPSAQETQLYAQGPQHHTPLQEQKISVQLSLGKQPQATAEQPGGFTHLSHPRSQENNLLPHQQTPHRQDSRLQQPGSAAFRALPLLSSDLPHTSITVSHSFVRPNDRGKEVLSFIVFVDPGKGKGGWKVEKMYSDVLGLDQRVRSSVGKGVGKKIVNLPEGKLWKDHAPAKVDQRKAVLENYLQTLIQLPVKNNDEVIAFFTSDIVRDMKQPVMQAGHKEGYLTKRGKNFGGWKTRFFVLQGPVLEYYDCRGGAQLGSITITGAQIARQHRTERPPTLDDEKEYRHAFLIVEAKKGPGGNHPRHVLCAESDEDRDSWVEMLVRYYTGAYSEDLVFINPSSGLSSIQTNSLTASSQQPGPIGQPRSSTSSNDVSNPSASRAKAPVISRDDSKGGIVPIAQLPPDAANAKLYPSEDHTRSSSPSKSLLESLPTDKQGGGGPDSHLRVVDRGIGLPSSLPDSAPLSNGNIISQRANSELGHYPDLQDYRSGTAAHPNQRQSSPEQYRNRDAHDGRKMFNSSLGAVAPSPTTPVPPPALERVPSPEKLDVNGKVKISGPMNGAPIPSGFKFGGKEVSSSDATAAANDRREKAKSRSFWGFGKTSGDKSHLHTAHIPRAVFGVPLEEALEVAQMCNLPAIVFRSIQYLEAKKADQEEGIYRLSGSSAVIKNLKDRFNNEGDVDLLASDEYWDPHAIAGLLKSFLRELPASILTRELHLKFLAVIDFVDAQERIKELSHLIAALPLANYSLLRALTAHLILIVQNSNVNKMTMRNVGIVFSPTLGIPAGVFSLMLGEFNRVFNVDADHDHDDLGGQEDNNGMFLEDPLEPLRRNSRQYSDAAADQLLGLSGRSLSTPAEETQSDYDDYSIQEESGPETTEEVTVESYSISSPTSALTQRDDGFLATPTEETLNAPTATGGKVSDVATSRGLNVAVTHSERGNRHSRMIGLPTSPRPTPLADVPSTPSPTLMRPND